MNVSERSPEEVIRLEIQEEAKVAKDTARKSRKGKISIEDCDIDSHSLFNVTKIVA